MKPMRLLVVTQYFWPETFRINELVAELVRRGHSVTILTGKPNYPSGRVFPEFASDPTAFATFSGAEVVRVPIIARGTGRGLMLALNYLSFAASAMLLGAWKLRHRDFDAVFVYQPSPVTAVLPGLFIGRIKKAAVALWVLDLWPETLLALGLLRPGKLYALVERATQWIYRNCDLVLGQSKRISDALRERTGGKVDVAYFPAWSDEVFSGNDRTHLAPEVPHCADCFTILFAGNIGEAQDFPSILDAATKLRDKDDIRWVIVGDGRMSAWLNDEIARRGLGHRMLMVGRHPLERMPEFFAHADALLVSLKSDTLFGMTVPGKLQAYLASGIPVLAMLDGEGAELLAEAGAGLSCPSGSGHGLAEIAEKLARTDRAERRAMGQHGRDHCAREFSLSKLVSFLELSLAQLADSQR